MNSSNKQLRGAASQFFVAGELCRRGVVAVVTLGNCPNTDILCSNQEGDRFAHIQVKTFRPGARRCPVGMKAEKDYGDKFFWVLVGLSHPEDQQGLEYYVVPSSVMARNIRECFTRWRDTPGCSGQEHDPDHKMRTVELPPAKNLNGWKIEEFRDRWDLILKCIDA